MEMYQTIKIVMSNGSEVMWQKDEWDDYCYDGKFFIVVKNHRRIGFYNLDNIISIIVE